MPRSRHNRCTWATLASQRGFTLVEVMVALAVIAIALSASISSSATAVNNLAGMKERTIAHFVAMNELARVELEGNKIPQKLDGTTEMAGRDWYWKMKIENTADASNDLKYLDIRVYGDERDENSIVTLRSMVAAKLQ